jgi:hypothetical protein
MTRIDSFSSDLLSKICWNNHSYFQDLIELSKKLHARTNIPMYISPAGLENYGHRIEEINQETLLAMNEALEK